MAEPTARPWLSILVPVYNVEPYLEACFESFMPQLDEGVEVVAVEDRSTDGSAALLQRVAERWPGRIRVHIQPENRGISAVRNALVEAARGDYLWFIDSDDLMEPGAVAALHRIVNAHQPDMVLCDYRVLRARAGLKHRLRGEGHRRTFDGRSGEAIQDTRALYGGMVLAGHLHVWSKITHRRIWSKGIRFPVGRYYEDTHVAPRLAARSQRFFHANQVWLAYRQHADSILGQVDERKLRDLMGHLADLSDDLKQTTLAHDPEARFALAHLATRSLIATLRQYDRRGTPAAAWAEARSAFERALPMSADELARAYLRRGWLARWWRLRHWLRRQA